MKYDGPSEVVMKIGVVAYKLKLLERLKLHPSFHVSFLNLITRILISTECKQRKHLLTSKRSLAGT